MSTVAGTAARDRRVAPRRRPRHLLGTILAWAWAVGAIAPLVWVAAQSVRPDPELLARPLALPDPATWSIEAYVRAFGEARMGSYFGNSAIVVACVVAAVLVLATAGGYALSRLEFPGRRACQLMIYVVMVFPGAVLLLPMFLVTWRLSLLDSLVGLIIPYTTFTLPLSVLLMKAAFDALPADLFAAARMDGCGEVRLLTEIALPLVPSALASVGFLVFMPVWEEFLWAFISVTDSANFTIPIGLVSLESNKQVLGYNVGFAGMVIAAAPVVIALVVSQRSFFGAITAGALKG